MAEYNWATLGCGVIAHQLADAMKAKGRALYSVANRTYDKAISFAEEYGIKKVYGNIEEVFEDENVDIIYISTPHNTHIEYLRKALSHGKHVICEKSITLNSAELNEAIDLAEKNHVVLAEAMTIYHMPIYKKLDEIIKYISSLGDGVKKIQLLKYHSLGKMKYQWIGKECVKFEEPDEVHREYILSRMRKLPFYVEWN